MVITIGQFIGGHNGVDLERQWRRLFLCAADAGAAGTMMSTNPTITILVILSVSSPQASYVHGPTTASPLSEFIILS